MHHGMATYGGGTLLVAPRTTYLLDEKLSKFSLSALMSVEADAGLSRVTRLMKLTARSRGHTIFDLNGPLL